MGKWFFVGSGAGLLVLGLLIASYYWFSKQSFFSFEVEKEQSEVRGVTHLACIMDGNRRWAKKKGMVPWHGHQEGAQAVKRVMEFCLENRIPYLSLYTFSLENFRRSPEEVTYLFDLLVTKASQEADECIKHGVRLRFVGDRSLFPEHLLPVITDLEAKTGKGKALTINFLFCYGSRQEIAHATQAVARKVQAGEIKADEITPELLQEHLWLADMPDPDIIIRTSGLTRLSNFMLYQAAYSEFYFLDCLWPDIQKEDLKVVLNEFHQRQRNFGT